MYIRGNFWSSSFLFFERVTRVPRSFTRSINPPPPPCPPPQKKEEGKKKKKTENLLSIVKFAKRGTKVFRSVCKKVRFDEKVEDENDFSRRRKRYWSKIADESFQNHHREYPRRSNPTIYCSTVGLYNKGDSFPETLPRFHFLPCISY